MRYAALSLGLFTVIMAFWLTAYTLTFSAVMPLVWVTVATLWLNAIVLLWVGAKGAGKTAGRIGRMGKLWLDAKEAELEKKAGAEAPTRVSVDGTTRA